MAAQPNCSMKSHTAYMRQPGWGMRRKVLGCVPKPTTGPPVMAPTDLRVGPLPVGWSTMIDLRLEGGNTEYLPNFPGTLESISLDNNNIRELPPIPPQVRVININKNNLTALPPLPAGLNLLNIRNNNIATLPNVPPALDNLHITHNNLETLQSLAETEIVRLGLGFNNLKALPDLPDTLRKLGCSNNQIKVIQGLPDRLRVLNCSSNPLETLQIDNLTRIEVLIANDCGLKIIPLLPPPDAGIDEDGRTYYFENNDFSPEFEAIYQRYRTDPWTDGKLARFRQEVLEEHRRLLRVKGETLVAMRTAFKGRHLPPGPPGPNGAPTGTPNVVRRALEGNYGPTNLIAQFITGIPGTLEQQRLGILQQREDLGNVPAGTTRDARARIANVAVRPLAPGASNFLQKRAKLYITSNNINAARARYQLELEAELERLRIEAQKKAYLRAYGLLTNELRLRDLAGEADALRFEGSLSANNSDRVMEKYADIEGTLSDFTLNFGQEEVADEAAIRKLRTAIAGDEAFKTLLKNKTKSFLWLAIRSKVLNSRDSAEAEGLLVTAARFPQFYQAAESQELLTHLEYIVGRVLAALFDEEDMDELNTLSAELKDSLRPNDSNAVSVVSDAEIAADVAAVAAVDALSEAGNDDEENDLPPGVEVLNDNNDGLALGIAMGEAAAENAALEANLAAIGENNDEEEEENNQGGGKQKRGKRRTPRNRKHKAKRQTRKQK